MTTTVATSKSSKKSSKSAAKGAPESSPILVAPPKPEPVAEPTIPTPPDSKGTTRDASLPKARKMEQKVAYVVKCLVAIQRETRGWGAEVEAAVGEAFDTISAARAAVAKLPDTFQPPKAAPGQGRNVKPLAEGDAIDITDKAAPRYADVLDASDLKGLTVTRVIGAQVVAKTASGTKVVLPRGHVAPVKSVVA